jgi:hypothetical protein
MSTPDHDCLDAETILNDLCASKINASISRIGDGGFHFVLGDPPQAEGWSHPSRFGERVMARHQMLLPPFFMQLHRPTTSERPEIVDPHLQRHGDGPLHSVKARSSR